MGISSIIGGGISAIGSIFGASSAADAQKQAAQMAMAQQQRMFDTGKKALDPFINMGQSTLSKLQALSDTSNADSPAAALMKLIMPGANMSDTLAQTPGFQFTQDYGLKAVNNALAARGLGGSGGAVAKGAANFVTGLTNNTWQSLVNALQSGYGLQSNVLQGLINTGASAAGSLMGNSTQVGSNMGSVLTGMGNAQGAANMTIGNAIGGLGNSFVQGSILNQLLGKSGGAGGISGLYANSTLGGMPNDI